MDIQRLFVRLSDIEESIAAIKRELLPTADEPGDLNGVISKIAEGQANNVNRILLLEQGLAQLKREVATFNQTFLGQSARISKTVNLATDVREYADEIACFTRSGDTVKLLNFSDWKKSQDS